MNERSLRWAYKMDLLRPVNELTAAVFTYLAGDDAVIFVDSGRPRLAQAALRAASRRTHWNVTFFKGTSLDWLFPMAHEIENLKFTFEDDCEEFWRWTTGLTHLALRQVLNVRSCFKPVLWNGDCPSLTTLDLGNGVTCARLDAMPRLTRFRFEQSVDAELFMKTCPAEKHVDSVEMDGQFCTAVRLFLERHPECQEVVVSRIRAADSDVDPRVVATKFHPSRLVENRQEMAIMAKAFRLEHLPVDDGDGAFGAWYSEHTAAAKRLTIGSNFEKKRNDRETLEAIFRTSTATSIAMTCDGKDVTPNLLDLLPHPERVEELDIFFVTVVGECLMFRDSQVCGVSRWERMVSGLI